MQFRLLSRYLLSSYSRSVAVINCANASRPVLSPLSQCQSGRTLVSSTRATGGVFSREDTSLCADRPALLYVQKRFKKKFGKKAGSKKGAAQEEEDESDQEEDSDAELELSVDDDTKVISDTVPSLRLDAFGKVAFNIARSKFEEHFYAGLIRVNGERVGKKNQEIQVDDEIDLIRGFNVENRDLLDINRVNILKVDDKAASSGRIRLSFRRTNKLTVPNYERDPYDGAL